ncbi:187-kda microtubule-associated protein air9 [Phtheirospermum japonicum]|uniref:187-kDa microtubule-associated protein air9 n=1 Tax=Phtheirospermum japonicum TaxID=374723 RepID=A0A830CI23_9LAMI|nr:187-kda microtubule-associated protein air9 [Phtheirospermum japonicum]
MGVYFGGKEGPSTFEWLREDKDNGECTLVLTGTNEYTLTKEDIGQRLVFVYVPVNFEGQEGKSMSAMSQIVKQAPPKVTNVKIIGELKEGSKVTVTGIVTGGTEASSRVQWFKTSSSIFEGENDIEALSTSKIAKAFRIPLGAVGKYIVAKFTPMTPDALPPSINFLSITGDYSEGGVLTASYGYIGGHEGKSIYNWYLHEVESDSGTLIPEVSGSLQYRIPKDAIGKFISFTCTPVRDDGIEGEPRTCTGQERVRPDDIDFFISVSCEPIRSDWARGPIVLSEQVGPIVPGPPTCRSLEFHGSLVEGSQLSFIASYRGGEKGDCLYEWFRVKDDGLKEKLHVGEFLDLTLDEVGDCVELVYTPVRVDGLKGAPKTLVSCPVAPGEPVGVELLIPDCCEGQEVVPTTRYFGGREGDGKYIWFRTENKLDESALIELSNNCENVDICGQELTYTPSLEDVGSYLALYWLPTRSDALPIVNNVRVEKLSSSTYNGEGEYFGGYEGESCFSWYRESDDGTVALIGGANSKTYEVSDEDYNCRLLFGYTPVRSDSVIGELVLSEPSDVVLPEVPRIEILALTGKAVERELLTAVEVIPNSENQHLVWGKYKKEVKYQWFFSSESGMDKSFEPFPSQRSCSYKVRFEDIGETGRMYEANVDDVGYRLVAIYTPIRDDGVEGQPVSASTDPIAVEPDVHKEVKQKLDLGSVKFEALCDKDRSPKRVPGMGSLERRILEVNRKRVKVVKPGSKTSFPTTEIRGSYSPPFHVELFRNDQHRLRIVVDSENEVDLMVQTRHLRDVIVLVIRGLAQRFNSTSLNTLLKIEA